MKNKRIRTAMVHAGINQMQLAELLSIPQSEVTVMLNKYELAVREQNEIVARIREADAMGAWKA